MADDDVRMTICLPASLAARLAQAARGEIPGGLPISKELILLLDEALSGREVKS